MYIAINKSSEKMKNKVAHQNMNLYNSGFKNYDLSNNELYNLVAIDGYPFCIAKLKENQNGRCERKTENFESCEIIGLDIDNSNENKYWSYDEAIEDPFIKKNALFIYSTPSNTEDKNRFRIVFLLPQKINDEKKVSEISKALNKKFLGDEATSSCVQTFFGSTNSNSKFFGNTFNEECLQSIINEFNYENSTEREKMEFSGLKDIKVELTDIEDMLDYIYKDGKVENYIWFQTITILSAYCKLTPEKIKELMSKYFNDLGDIDTKIKYADSYLNNKTIASLIYLAKKKGYKIPVHLQNKRKDQVFWDIIQYGKKDDPSYKCNYCYASCLNFLLNNNFHIFNKGGNREIIRIEDNIIKVENKFSVIQYLRDFINKTEKVHELLALDKFDRNSNKIFDSIMTNMQDDTFNIESKIIRDTREDSFMFFNNGYLKINNEIQYLEYSQLKGYVWESSLIKHNINLDVITNGHFENFISKISSNRYNDTIVENRDKYNTIKSTIGYLLHKFKSPNFTKCVILTDEVISNSPQGGTGKSLFQQSLSKVVKTVYISGMDFQINKNYTYEEVKSDTRLINIDDCRINFDFTELFSNITSDLTIRKKYLNQITIPFQQSPKFCLSTNDVIKGYGSSYSRRMIEIEFSNYFNEIHTPLNEYGKNFFIEWDEEEWNKFYVFMASCIQYYLKNDIVGYERVNIATKKIKAAIGETLYEFLDNHIIEDKYYSSRYLINEYEIVYAEKITATKLTQSLNHYSSFKKFKCVYDYDKNIKSKVYIITNRDVKTLSEIKKVVDYEITSELM